MPAQRMNVAGREVWVQELGFDIANEDWNEYKLLDGGKIRVKTVVTRIFRVVDENGKQVINANGEPEVVVRHAPQVVAIDLPYS